MENERFDRLARVFNSRRTALAGLLGGAATLLGLTGAEEASGHNPTAACRRLADPVKRRRCLRRARAHNQKRHRCKPQPVAVTCKNRCGTVRNNCKTAMACTCPSGKSCLDNGSCSRTCRVEGTPGDCPAGCACGVPAVDSGLPHCYPDTVTDCRQLPVCTSMAECPLGFFCGKTDCELDEVEGQCVPVCPS